MGIVVEAGVSGGRDSSLLGQATCADGSVEGVARMTAAGLGIPEGTFLEAGKYG